LALALVCWAFNAKGSLGASDIYDTNGLTRTSLSFLVTPHLSLVTALEVSFPARRAREKTGVERRMGRREIKDRQQEKAGPTARHDLFRWFRWWDQIKMTR